LKTAPIWRRDGRELFYRTRDAIMAVPLTTGGSFSAGASQELFRAPYEQSFDVSSDGQRFLMIKTGTAASSAERHVVLNWTEDAPLSRQFPVTKAWRSWELGLGKWLGIGRGTLGVIRCSP